MRWHHSLWACLTHLSHHTRVQFHVSPIQHGSFFLIFITGLPPYKSITPIFPLCPLVLHYLNAAFLLRETQGKSYRYLGLRAMSGTSETRAEAGLCGWLPFRGQGWTIFLGDSKKIRAVIVLTQEPPHL